MADDLEVEVVEEIPPPPVDDLPVPDEVEPPEYVAPEPLPPFPPLVELPDPSPPYYSEDELRELADEDA